MKQGLHLGPFLMASFLFGRLMEKNLDQQRLIPHSPEKYFDLVSDFHHQIGMGCSPSSLADSTWPGLIKGTRGLSGLNANPELLEEVVEQVEAESSLIE